MMHIGTCRRGVLGALVLGAWLSPWQGVAAGEVSAIELWYLENEAGTEAYEVRYLVTPRYMRSDEGDDANGFVLFDRERRFIYNVVPENRTTLEIDGNGELPAADLPVALDVERSTDPDAPLVDGKAAVTLKLRAGGALCSTAVVVPGLLEDARAVFSDFARALAVQQLRTLDNTPRQYQTPCFLAGFIYATDYHLQDGVPLLEFSPGGDRRELLRYREVVVDESLFELPKGFVTFQTPVPGD